MHLTDVLAARRRIEPYVWRTPLVDSPWLSACAGATVRLKLESLQVTHSFKARGAVNAAVALVARASAGGDRARSLVTASAGNHGRALAYAAERLDLRLVVFTPRGAPRAKLDHITHHGADLRAEAATYEEAERLAKAYAAAERVTYVSPYSHPDVVAGAATVALEILEDWPEVDTILTSVGGGGLVSGVAMAAKAMSNRVEVIGVEAEASPAFSTSLRAGAITEVHVGPTIADGLAGNMDPETITFDFVQRFVDRVVLASERAIEDAVRDLVTREHLVAEGAGATAVAWLAGGPGLGLEGQNVAVVISGSNIDAARLAALLSN
ncbi:MAG: pyridoxal-phosphate dependent enzyme [Acidobacteria bacterium]|nr:pyridoxal-phosphate dependent enzyme [Acidobacteriota bacterium]